MKSKAYDMPSKAWLLKSRKCAYIWYWKSNRDVGVCRAVNPVMDDCFKCTARKVHYCYPAPGYQYRD